MREPVRTGRPREFDAEAALAEIMDVFWAKGFEGTSLADLVAATGLKKGSLYAAFGDKRAMYLEALALYDRTAVDGAVETLTGGGAPDKRIAAFLQFAIDAVAIGRDRRGCFLCNASVDQAVLDRRSARAVKRSLGRLVGALAEALSALVANKAKREAEAHHLLSVYFGLRVLAKGGLPVDTLVETKNAALRCIRSLR